MDISAASLLVSEVASRLGVSPQRVRALIASGDLDARFIGRTWFVDPVSLDRYRHARQPSAGRALSPVTAWAALLTRFGSEVDDRTQQNFHLIDERRARVRALRARAVDDWRWLARRRCTVQRYATRPAYVTRIAREGDAVRAGVSSGLRHGLVDGTESIDLYGGVSTIGRIVERYRLCPDPMGNVTLRTINIDDPGQLAIICSAELPALVVAVDLLEDRDARTAAAGHMLFADELRRIEQTAR